MSLRAKILLPLVLLCCTLFGYLYGFWMPRSLGNMEADYRESVERHLESVVEGLVPLLLANQLDTVHENLNALKAANSDWTGVRLLDRENRTLYPLRTARLEGAGPLGKNVHTLQKRIHYLDRDLGALIVTIDFAPRLSAVKKRHWELMTAVAVLLLIFVAAAGWVLEKVVLRPVHALNKASKSFAMGTFDVSLPPAGSDEVGGLVESFADMRDAISRYQSELQLRSQVLVKSEQRLAEAQRISHLGSWELDLLKNELTWTDEIYRIFGLQPQEFAATYEAFLETIHPDDRSMVNDAYTRSVEHDTPYDIVHRIIRKSDNEIRYVHEKCEHLRDTYGKIVLSLGTVLDITELKQAEAEIKESEEKFRSISMSAQDAILMIDHEGKISYWNRAAEKIFSYSSDEIMGKELHLALAPPHYHQAFREGFSRFVKTGQGPVVNKTFEMVALKKDGKVFPVELSISALKIKERWNAIGIVRDITERKKAEAESRQLASIVESSDDAIFGKTLEGIVLTWNKGAEAVYGYSAEEIKGRSVSILCPPDSADDVPQILDRIRRGEHIERYETLRRRKDGRNIYVSLTMSPVKNGAGRIVGASVIARDITDLKKAEEVLRRANAYNRSLIEASLDPLVTIGPDGKITDVNAATEAVTGRIRNELIGTDFSDYFTRPEKARAGYQQVFREGVVRDYALEIRHRNGSVTPVLYNASLYRDEAGKATGVFAAARDISERIRAEESLQKLSQAVEQSPASIVITDAEANIEYVNPKFTQITGYGFDEAVGQNPRLLKSGKTPPEVYRSLWEAIPAGQIWHGEFQNKKKNGELFWEWATIAPLKNKEGRITHYIAIKEDVTERKKLEEQLRQAQKMEAIGQLAGGIAHDFNNILSAIIGYGSLLQMKMNPADPLRLNADLILESANRAANLTHSLLAFSRKQVMNPAPLNLNDIIRRIDKFLRRIIGEDIVLTTECKEDPLNVLADYGQIEQVLMNLATNARDAMSHGGLLLVVTEAVEIDEEFRRLHGYGKAGRYALISVTDTGAGMDETTRGRIFEPFFTTKETGKGTGLGLSIVYGIIKQHNGYINVYSEPGKGTTFKIYLPLIATREKAQAPAAAIQAFVGGTETILVAEDDAALRQLTQAVLQEGGYSVIVAKDGEDAVKKFRSCKDEIHLCLFDMIMPKMSGKEAYVELMKMRPGLKVLFTSGYTADKMLKEGILDRGLDYIAKPMSPRDLLKKVREVLDR